MPRYSHSGGLNLDSYEGLPSCVVPGKPQGSKFFRQVHDGTMPKGGEPLPSEQVQAIYDWILLGALQN